MFGKLFGKTKPTEIIAQVENLDSEDTNVDLDIPDINSLNSQISWLISHQYTTTFDENKRTLLIMDDREEIISSIMDDLQSLDFENNEFNLNDYNILKIHSKMAGFNVLDILKKAPLIEIDFALLDIVLGGKKIIDGKRHMVDGIDVAIEIWENFTNAEIMFFSGCIIENSSKDIFNFKDRFQEYTGDPIDNYLLPKDSNFTDELEKLTEFFLGISH